MSHRFRDGVSAFEWIVIIASFGVAAALLMPSIQAARETSRKSTCAKNLKELGVALQSYESSYKFLPPSYLTQTKINGDAFGVTYGDEHRNGLPGWAWGTLLLPQLNRESLYDGLDLNKPCWSPDFAKQTRSRIQAFLCPSVSADSSGFPVQKAGADAQSGTPIILSDGKQILFGHSHYAVNAGTAAPWNRAQTYSYDFSEREFVSTSYGLKDFTINGPFYPNSKLSLKAMTDGLSNTIFIGEHSSIVSHKTWVGVVPTSVSVPRMEIRPWLSETNSGGSLVGIASGPKPSSFPLSIVRGPNDPFGPTDGTWSEHGNGSQCLLGDGSVRYYSAFINPSTWIALSTRNGGENVKE